MDFFHCNNCYVQPASHNNRSFWLTNCGHSFCDNCANTTENVCRLCQNSCKYLALTSDIPDDVKSYFSNAMKELKKAIKVILIQNKHCRIYMEEYAPKLESKYFAAKMATEQKAAESEMLKITIQEKNKEINSLQNNIKQLQAEIEDMKKQFAMLSKRNMNMSPVLPHTPKSMVSMEDVFFTPRSRTSTSSSNTLRVDTPRTSLRQNQGTYLSSASNSPFQDKNRLLEMHMQLKNNSLLKRINSGQNILRTPRSNQTFSMSSINSPESSEDERWGSEKKSVHSFSNPLHFQRTPNKMKGKFF